MRKFTPNGRSVSCFTLRMAGSNSSGRSVAAARNPNAPALHDAATSSGVATHPIAVWMIG